MTILSNRSQTAKMTAKAAGYYIREGSYSGTTDDRLGRWYFGHTDDEGFYPYGAGHRTQADAWAAACEHAHRISEIKAGHAIISTRFFLER